LLLGRQRERAQIKDLLAAAIEDGRSDALLLHGEAGIGKSALLADAAAQAEELGFQILRARGYESESDIPLRGPPRPAESAAASP
jgi:predicted ATP-dependent serine protease